MALLAIASGPTLHAKAPKVKAYTPARVMRPSGIVTRLSDERYSLNGNSPRIAYVAPATDLSSNWAGTVSAHVMSDKVIDYMENKYTAAESYAMGGDVRNFVYFYGFDITSQDARGVALGIDQRQELKLRDNMTKSLRGYMLGKGLVEYLNTLEFAAPYISTMQKVERASQISVEIKSSNPEIANTDRPWKITTGPDLGSRTVFAKAGNGAWNLELRDSFKLNEMRFTAGRTYYRSQYSMRYINASNIVTPGYQYQFAKSWWARWNSDFPIKGINRFERVFHTMGLRHLF